MTGLTSPEDDQYRNTVFEALADGRRRTILRILKRLTPQDSEELATMLVAEEQEKSLVTVTPAEVERATLDIKHRHVPVLLESALITREDGVIQRTDHPALQDPKLDVMIETDGTGWDDLLSGLADKRRRITLSTLYRNDGSMERVDLATAVTDTLRADGDSTPAVEDVFLDLHHVHLPKLDDVGLVTYDLESESVSFEGHPDLDEEWLVAGSDDTPRAILSMATLSADIWTLEGRDNVTERGRALCESADEELFMMFTVEDPVETACLRRIQDALERSVDVYLGTQNKQLRDLVREQAPAVTIWEPQLDWLNLPPKREKVGRLIMADRKEIMIGTIGEDGPTGTPTETAITGTGEDNPLVMLLRELLGSRLDHLDAQSEDFRSQIPL
jgi:DNA-binding transcriptional ArsR family regulator